MTRVVRRRGRLSVVALAGWLFADLLLVLTLMSMGDRPDPLAATPSPSPSASRSASASPSPSPSETGPRAVEQKPVKFRVSGGDEEELVEQIRQRTSRWEGREAALVLTFGGSANGTQYAHRVNGLLHKARSGMFTAGTATEDFHDLGSRPSTAELWVYFYTSPG